MRLLTLATIAAVSHYAQAHGDHERHYEQQPIPANADWATRHMAGTNPRQFLPSPREQTR